MIIRRSAFWGGVNKKRGAVVGREGGVVFFLLVGLVSRGQSQRERLFFFFLTGRIPTTTTNKQEGKKGSCGFKQSEQFNIDITAVCPAPPPGYRSDMGLLPDYLLARGIHTSPHRYIQYCEQST